MIIATKADKISKNAKNRQVSLIRKTLGLSGDVPVIPFSSLSKEGKEEIWEYIDSFVERIEL